MKKQKIKTLVCGSTFGQFYLEALKCLPEHFELIGLMGTGSQRSVQCAQRYGIPLYTEVDELPDDITLACTVLRSGIMGGKGTELSLQLIERGINVLQEHPVHQTDIADCLRAAKQKGLYFTTGNLYIHLPAVRRFIACAQRLFKEQNALYLDISLATQVSFPLIHILLEALPNLRPFTINHVLKDEGPFQLVTGVMGSIPFTIRAHNEVNPDDPDNYLHLLHSISIGFPAGCLSLTDTHGPVVWKSRLHIPKGGLLKNLSAEEEAQLSDASTLMLGPMPPASYKDILSRQWVRAIGKDLHIMKQLIHKEVRIEKRAQQELLCARHWQKLTSTLGYPVLKPEARFQPIDIGILHEQVAKIAAEPEESPLHNAPPKQAVFDCHTVAEEELKGITHETVTTYITAVNTAAMSSMLHTLQSQGTLNDPTKEYTKEEILTQSQSEKRHHDVLSRWIRVMEEHGFLEKRNHKYSSKETISPQLINERWGKVKTAWNNKLGSEVSLQYLRNNADQLSDLMTDRQQAALLLFPEGRMEVANALYKDSLTARYLNQSVAEAVMRIAAEKSSLSDSKDKPKLNIVEIGAGTGATTECILPKLKAQWAHRLELSYLFSDVSSFFLGSAEKRFSRYPWVNYKTIDIDKDFKEQGLSPGSADIIIAAGVLNNAHNTRKVIAQFNNTLSPGGYMLITEPVEESLEILISQAFMMTPPVDDRSMTNTTFMQESQWLNLLTEAPVEKIVSIPKDNHALAPMGQRLFIVKKQ